MSLLAPVARASAAQTAGSHRRLTDALWVPVSKRWLLKGRPVSVSLRDRARHPWLTATLALAIVAMPLLSNIVIAQVSKPTHIKFREYSTLASASEIARRTLSPLIALDVARRTASSGRTMIEQSIKLADEDFLIYVPARQPPRGYTLLVFIPPWQEARLPAGWAPALERYGTIFISAARSGNDEGVIDRREPLALLAAVNALQQFAVNADAVFIGGFSGGARVAQRLALAYPDLFRGAILNAGSDPIGNQEIPIPPRDLFYRFQENSRLVYVTGEADPLLGKDQDSMRSMHQWCMFTVQGHVESSVGHEALGSNAFAWALSAALHDVPPLSNKLFSCRASIEQELNKRLDAAEQQLTDRASGGVEKLLRRIDAEYGGLAAPRSVEMAMRLVSKTQ